MCSIFDKESQWKILLQKEVNMIRDVSKTFVQIIKYICEHFQGKQIIRAKIFTPALCKRDLSWEGFLESIFIQMLFLSRRQKMFPEPKC